MHPPNPPNPSSALRRAFFQKSLLGITGLGMTAGGAWLAMLHHQKKVVPTEFWQAKVQDLDGATWQLSKLKGKNLLINFWATWCPPCVHELPEIERFHQVWASKGWQTLALAIDSPAAVQAFVNKNSLELPIAMSHEYGLHYLKLVQNPAAGLPFSAIISSSGHILEIKNGPTTFAELNAWAHTHTSTAQQ